MEEGGSEREFSSDDHMVFAMLMCFPAKIRQCMDLIVSSYVLDAGIRLPHLMTVTVIGSLDNPSQKEIREHLPFDKSYISILVRELIDMGCVVNVGEGKVQSLKLTEDGRRMESVSRMVRDIIDANIFKDFDEDERRAFESCLRKLESRIDILTQTYSQKVPRQ
ncbi:MAG: MarR family winged helix-turn-helix transcriptional regulator [Candidatus Methanomethylophilaceae archaeon]